MSSEGEKRAKKLVWWVCKKRFIWWAVTHRIHGEVSSAKKPQVELVLNPEDLTRREKREESLAVGKNKI